MFSNRKCRTVPESPPMETSGNSNLILVESSTPLTYTSCSFAGFIAILNVIVCRILPGWLDKNKPSEAILSTFSRQPFPAHHWAWVSGLSSLPSKPRIVHNRYSSTGLGQQGMLDGFLNAHPPIKISVYYCTSQSLPPLLTRRKPQLRVWLGGDTATKRMATNLNHERNA